ncbi:MAG: hypothetical protein H0Z33_16380 [Bacillaceae bacterium]|nr:hypothetical protein [Bacillaceae bacterium]
MARLINQLNKKSKRKWHVQDLKKITQGFSSTDIYDDEKLEELIKRVGKAAGVKLSKNNVKNVKSKIHSKFNK